MGVDRSISGSAGKVLVLSVRDVEVGLGVTVFLRQTEVDNIDLIAPLANSHQEVVGLDITVDERLGVDVLDAGNELIGQEENSLEGELSVAEVEEVLQAGAQKIKDHGVVVTFGAKPADERDANSTGQGLVDASLILKLGMLGLDALQLDGNLLTGDDVGPEVDVTEGAGADLPANTVFITDAEILGARKSAN